MRCPESAVFERFDLRGRPDRDVSRTNVSLGGKTR